MFEIRRKSRIRYSFGRVPILASHRLPVTARIRNLVEYEDSEELVGCVEKTVNDLQNDDIGLEDIGMILPNNAETDILSLLSKRLRKKNRTTRRQHRSNESPE